jgi:hypothetical protein
MEFKMNEERAGEYAVNKNTLSAEVLINNIKQRIKWHEQEIDKLERELRDIMKK